MKTIVFDLDGTLIDSAPDIHAAAARMLQDEGLEALPFEVIKSFIGNGVPKLVERVMAARSIEGAQNHARLTQVFMDHYEAASSDLTEVYPNVRETLEALRAEGYALAVCTNKPVEPAVAILRDLGLAEFFTLVIGGDSLPVRKPDPSVLAHTFAALGATSRLYVGDSEVDAETADRAAITFALFTEGYRKTPVDALPHAVAFDDFAQLPAISGRFFAEAVS